MQRELPRIQAAGATLVAISPERPDNALSMAEKNAIAFPVLTDRGNGYARQCGLVFTLPEELRPYYAQWGIDLPAHNGDDTFELPLPATYVVGQDGGIVLDFVDVDYTRRLEPSEVVTTLQRLSPRSQV